MILAGILAAGFGCWSCSGKTETFTLGSLPLETSALIYVAEDRHIFSDSGLAITIRDNDTGMGSVDGIPKGEVNMAIATEFVVVRKVLQKERIRILGAVN